MTVLYVKSDRCTDTILDFIRGGWISNGRRYNMEASGNYNAYFGHPNSSDDLAKYTITEILAKQQGWIDSQGYSAVGGYQIVRATLQGLVDQGKLNRNTLFDRPLQDSFGWILLCRHDYQKWWRKKIDDEQFAHNISTEWASLPDPFNGGKSHYDHVGPNHAGCSLQLVYDMLDRARALQ